MYNGFCESFLSSGPGETLTTMRRWERGSKRGREEEEEEEEEERVQGEVTQGHSACCCALLLQSMLQTSKSFPFGRYYVRPQCDRQTDTNIHTQTHTHTHAHMPRHMQHTPIRAQIHTRTRSWTLTSQAQTHTLVDAHSEHVNLNSHWAWCLKFYRSQPQLIRAHVHLFGAEAE